MDHGSWRLKLTDGYKDRVWPQASDADQWMEGGREGVLPLTARTISLHHYNQHNQPCDWAAPRREGCRAECGTVHRHCIASNLLPEPASASLSDHSALRDVPHLQHLISSHLTPSTSQLDHFRE
eukprot:862262-Pelagomonas_calceolata.AAC.6